MEQNQGLTDGQPVILSMGLAAGSRFRGDLVAAKWQDSARREDIPRKISEPPRKNQPGRTARNGTWPSGNPTQAGFTAQNRSNSFPYRCMKRIRTLRAAARFPKRN